MTQIKICGLRTPEDVAAVNEFMPDYIGFIFVKGRKRYIDPKTAYELKQKLNKGIKAVGVFINEAVEQVAQIAGDDVIDVIQLHGEENAEYIENLRTFTKKPIIKAIRVSEESDVKKAGLCRADIILFDCGVGGTGETFDWKLIKDFDKAYFLAGGLNSDNVAEAMEKLSPMGLDVSSGVETEGRKDRDKIERFINLVRKEDEKND